MLIHWPTVFASGLASFVELVEALTIVLAVGVVRGWRPALWGATAALAALAVCVWALGPRIGELDNALFKTIVGTLLLLFGLRWLRKAILRSAGLIPLHDEARAFSRKSESLRNSAPVAGRIDVAAALTAFNGVFVEGVEVVFIVLAVGGTGGHLMQASIGAVIAGLLVIGLGLAARKPLTRIPENTLKLAVGVLVTAFGTFWTGEGIGLFWPGDDFALLLLSAAYIVVSCIAVAIARAVKARAGPA